MEVDVKLQSLGKCGCYQGILFLSLSLIYLQGSWHVFAPVFTAADPGHTCFLTENGTDRNKSESKALQNFSNSSGKDRLIDGVKLESCSITYKFPNNESSHTACDNGWTYNSDQIDSTIVTEWDLVCDEDYKVELSTTIYMVGNACGALILTYFSDKFGRKRLLVVSLLLQGIIGFSVAFVNSYILFTILRFCNGVLNMGIGLTAFVMVTETYPASIRTIPSIGIQIFWGIGIMLLALFGYLFRDWRHIQMMISVPNFCTAIYVFFLPESIPWLIAKQKYQEADNVMSWARKLNKLSSKLDSSFNSSPVISDDVLVDEEENEVDMKNSIKALFCMKNIRCYVLIIIYLFIVNSFIYMGISFSTPILHGNIYLNLLISGLVEIPAYLISMFVITRVGRKIPLMVYLFLCAISTIVSALCPDTTADGTSLAWLKTTVFMISKFAITGSYSTIYLYSAEIFPTVVRNVAMGIASFFENLGAIGAPFIIYAAKKMPIIPVIAFSSAAILGGLLVMILPETNKKPLPQTISDTETLSPWKPALSRKNHRITEL